MRVGWLVLAGMVGCAAHAPAAGSGPLASPSALPTLKEATRLVRRGETHVAERLLRALLVDDGEAQASAAFDALLQVYPELPVDEASARLSAIVEAWPRSRAAVYAVDLLAELAIVGAPAAPLDGVTWLQGRGDYGDAKLTVMVFWETWCPYCRDEVPKLQGLLERRSGEGVQVLGLLRLSRGSGPEEVASFAAEHGLDFPLGQDPGGITEAFAVRGVPAIAIVREGVIVWRGHPMMLTEARLTELLAGG